MFYKLGKAALLISMWVIVGLTLKEILNSLLPLDGSIVIICFFFIIAVVLLVGLSYLIIKDEGLEEESTNT